MSFEGDRNDKGRNNGFGLPGEKDPARAGSGTSVEDPTANGTGGEILHRQLKSRHASMLALGGAIGTGLIITSGTALANSGPVGMLLAYAYVGTLCFAMFAALGEMAAFLPHQKGFAGHATRFLGPSFGAATGFMYWVKYLFQTGTQYSACAVIINYWIPTSKVNNGVWIAIFVVLTACMQMLPVRFFGEFEFWCSTFKVIVLVGLMLLAIIIDAGGVAPHEYIGFRAWKQLPFVSYLVPGATGRFAGFVAALVNAVYSYTGTEMVGIALGEMQNPRRNIARAVRACFYRILFLYIGSIFFIGLVVPANSPLLLAANEKGTNANASPFVVAINVAGIKVLPHIINAAALIFVFSAANSDVYVNSRTAFALASEGNIPKIFMRTNRLGVPWVSLCFTLMFSLLSLTAINTSAFKVFKYFVSAVTLVSTIVWLSIMATHVRWMQACKRQGIQRKDLPYTNRLNPYLSYWGMAGTAFVSLSKGFAAFVHHFDVVSFVVNYVAFPVALFAYLAYVIKYKSWITPIDEVDLTTDVRFYDDAEEFEAMPEKQPGIWNKIKYVWNS